MLFLPLFRADEADALVWRHSDAPGVRAGGVVGLVLEDGVKDVLLLQELLRRLFDYYRREPDKLPPEFQDIRMEEGVERAVCDYIAGMTDNYALEIYHTLFIPRSWSIQLK